MLVLLSIVLVLTSGRSDRGRSYDASETSPRGDYGRDRTPTRKTSFDSAPQKPSIPSSLSGSSYSSYKTAEERAAFVKQQAEQRMAERLAALGLKPPSKSGESLQQRQDRENKEREERLRQAEVEDAKREQERQRRLTDEQVSPLNVTKPSGKKPPPPPSRKVRTDSIDQRSDAGRKTEEVHSPRKEQASWEQSVKEQQNVERDDIKQLEYTLLSLTFQHRN